MLSNFNYSSITWPFVVGKHAQRKLKLYRKGHCNLCLMISTYSLLLEKCNYTTLHIRHIKAIASEVFNQVNEQSKP